MAPPCGTASKARNRWAKIWNGRPPPRPLRSSKYPMGIPGITKWEQLKVDAANKIYEAVAKFMNLSRIQCAIYGGKP